MTHLENISVNELREALGDAKEVQATKRLMVAIAYKQGVTQTELAEWYGLARKTVYNWLQRFDEDSIEKATSDASRPGRPPKLDHEERTEVHKVLEGSPESAGYDAEEWNTALVQRLLEEQFDVEYSRTSAFRFLT